MLCKPRKEPPTSHTSPPHLEAAWPSVALPRGRTARHARVPRAHKHTWKAARLSGAPSGSVPSVAEPSSAPGASQPASRPRLTSAAPAMAAARSSARSACSQGGRWGGQGGAPEGTELTQLNSGGGSREVRCGRRWRHVTNQPLEEPTAQRRNTLLNTRAASVRLARARSRSGKGSQHRSQHQAIPRIERGKDRSRVVEMQPRTWHSDHTLPLCSSMRASSA
jgi:hypothetical protein